MPKFHTIPNLSVTTLDNRLSSRLEPRAAAPHTRLRTVRALHEAGIPVGVLVAPVIPPLKTNRPSGVYRLV